MSKNNIKLNQQQLMAVKSIDGPVLLLAVPGSGKTTVLVTRLGYMIFTKKIPPERILTLTYTVAATRDMEARFEAFFGTEMRGRLEFRTLNGICAKIINYYGRKIGKTSFKLVTDEKIIASILSSVFQKIQDSYPTESDIKNIRTSITYIKNMMLTAEEVKRMEEESDSEIAISQIYKAYCEEMRNRGLMDYDDQMVYALNILKRSPETLQYFQELYQYICVDEAQDTSKIQHAIIAFLAKNNENLFMVGDEDQSIYGFRAAYPEALLDFEKNHPRAKILLMEENYRSNGRIVEKADSFIQKNTMRHEKHMKAFRKNGTEVKEISLKGRRMQYTYLAKLAKDCNMQTAVLYRDNESILPLVNILEKNQIPYRIKNAELLFFTNRVVLDIQNIMRFALNPEDTELFLQIYYKLNMYINKQNAAKYVDAAIKHKLPVLDAAVRYGHLPGYSLGSIKAIQTHLKNLLEEPPAQGINRIVRFMGYGEYLERAGLNDQKIYILQSIAAHEKTVEDFLVRMQELQKIIKEKKQDASCPFILSTIHASKGLEYDNVYMIDVEDGIFPESVPEDKKDKEAIKIYEEERRLFYVGMTRAKENLHIFRLPGESVFCKEVFGEKKKQEKEANPIPVQRKQSLSTLLQKTRIKSKNESASKENYNKFMENLGEGVIVKHKKFGIGVIAEITEKYVTIDFNGEQRKLAAEILFINNLIQIM